MEGSRGNHLVVKEERKITGCRLDEMASSNERGLKTFQGLNDRSLCARN